MTDCMTDSERQERAKKYADAIRKGYLAPCEMDTSLSREICRNYLRNNSVHVGVNHIGNDSNCFKSFLDFLSKFWNHNNLACF